MTPSARAFLVLLAMPLYATLAVGQTRPAPSPQVQGRPAQSRPPLKRGMPAVAPRPTCAPGTTPRAATTEQRRAARELAQRAQQSAILGDRTTARDQLRQASALDPTNQDLAYQLARAQEAIGANDAAALEYCRFLALAPSAPEASEVRDRIAALTPRTQPVSDKITAPFLAGVTAYEAGTLCAGGGRIQQRDRAPARLGRRVLRSCAGERRAWAARAGRRGSPAILAAPPGSRGSRRGDRAHQQPARRAALSDRGARPRTRDPGAGQMYTGRKLLGVITLAAAGGALAYAVKTDLVTKEFVVNPTDPFGNPLPPFIDTRTEVGRPHLAAGLATLGAIAGVTAIEAFVHCSARERGRAAVRRSARPVIRRRRHPRHAALTATVGAMVSASRSIGSSAAAGAEGADVSMLQSTSAASSGAYV
jgi:hypothetical protein